MRKKLITVTTGIVATSVLTYALSTRYNPYLSDPDLFLLAKNDIISLFQPTEEEQAHQIPNNLASLLIKKGDIDKFKTELEKTAISFNRHYENPENKRFTKNHKKQGFPDDQTTRAVIEGDSYALQEFLNRGWFFHAAGASITLNTKQSQKIGEEKIRLLLKHSAEQFKAIGESLRDSYKLRKYSDKLDLERIEEQYKINKKTRLGFDLDIDREETIKRYWTTRKCVLENLIEL